MQADLLQQTIGPTSAELARCSQTSGQQWPKFSRLGWNSGHIRPTRAKFILNSANAGLLCTSSGEISPESANFGPIGPDLADFDRLWADFEPNRLSSGALGGIWDDVGQSQAEHRRRHRPSSGRFAPEPARTSPSSARNRRMRGEFRPILVDIGPTWVALDVCSTQPGEAER